jgi:hypothetical protein
MRPRGDHDEVGVAEGRAEVLRGEHPVDPAVRASAPAHPEDAQTEPSREARDLPADVADPDDHDRAPRDRGHEDRIPPPFPLACHEVRHAVIQHEEGGQRVLAPLGDVHTARVRQHDLRRQQRNELLDSGAGRLDPPKARRAARQVPAVDVRRHQDLRLAQPLLQSRRVDAERHPQAPAEVWQAARATGEPGRRHGVVGAQGVVLDVQANPAIGHGHRCSSWLELRRIGCGGSSGILAHLGARGAAAPPCYTSSARQCRGFTARRRVQEA